MLTNVHAGIDALNRAIACWNAGDLPGCLALYREDAVLHGCAGVGLGIARIGQSLALFRFAFPDSRLIPEDILSDGNKLACRFTIHATRCRGFRGVPPLDRAVSLSAISLMRFADRHCVEHWHQADWQGLAHLDSAGSRSIALGK